MTTVPATLMVFDLLRLDGEDLADRPLEERRALLEELPLADSTWQVPAAYDDGDMLFDATLQQGLEGVVSKRRGSRYRFDAAQRATGASSPTATAARSSSAAGARRRARRTGWPRCSSASRPPDGLLYRGRVGSGIAGATSARLARCSRR